MCSWTSVRHARWPKVTQGHPRSPKVKVQKICILKSVISRKMTQGQPRSSKVAQGQSQENMCFEECDITEDSPRSTKVIQGRPRTKSEKCVLGWFWGHRRWPKVNQSHPRSSIVKVRNVCYCIIESVLSRKMAEGHPRSGGWPVVRLVGRCVYGTPKRHLEFLKDGIR